MKNISYRSLRKALKKLGFLKRCKATYITAETEAANAVLNKLVAETFIRHVDVGEYMQIVNMRNARIDAAKKAHFWVYLKEVSL